MELSNPFFKTTLTTKNAPRVPVGVVFPENHPDAPGLVKIIRACSDNKRLTSPFFRFANFGDGRRPIMPPEVQAAGYALLDDLYRDEIAEHERAGRHAAAEDARRKRARWHEYLRNLTKGRARYSFGDDWLPAEVIRRRHVGKVSAAAKMEPFEPNAEQLALEEAALRERLGDVPQPVSGEITRPLNGSAIGGLSTEEENRQLRERLAREEADRAEAERRLKSARTRAKRAEKQAQLEGQRAEEAEAKLASAEAEASAEASKTKTKTKTKKSS